MRHYYTIEQERLQAEYDKKQAWQYVRDSNGLMVVTKDGYLMINGMGQYASDTGFQLVEVNMD